MGVLPAGLFVYPMSACLMPEEVKRGLLDPLELQMVVSCLVGAETANLYPLEDQPVLLTAVSPLQSHPHPFDV